MTLSSAKFVRILSWGPMRIQASSTVNQMHGLEVNLFNRKIINNCYTLLEEYGETEWDEALMMMMLYSARIAIGGTKFSRNLEENCEREEKGERRKIEERDPRERKGKCLNQIRAGVQNRAGIRLVQFVFLKNISIYIKSPEFLKNYKKDAALL